MNVFHIAKMGDLVSTACGVLRVGGYDTDFSGTRTRLIASGADGGHSFSPECPVNAPTAAEMDKEIERLVYRVRDLEEWRRDVRKAVAS
jgi:hypothetical protein